MQPQSTSPPSCLYTVVKGAVNPLAKQVDFYRPYQRDLRALLVVRLSSGVPL